MKRAVLSAILMLTQAIYGASVTKSAPDNIERQYLYTLTNFALRAHDPEVFEDWLNSFRKDKDYSQEAMAKALVAIAKRGIASMNRDDLHMANASINAIGYMMLTNTLPYLSEWTLSEKQVAVSSFDAYGQITGFDERYLELGKNAENAGSLDSWFVRGQMGLLLSLDNSLANGQKLPQYYRLQEKVRYKMATIMFDNTGMSFESCMGKEEMLSSCLDGYTNSIEHVRAQRKIYDFLIQDKKPILKTSACRIIGDSRNLSDEEWYFRATNSCQSEIARVMALPESERLNMTAILDAKIAAIEEEEARAARRAIWKRRLSIGGVSMLTLAIVFTITCGIRQSGLTRIRRQHAP